ncbi:hypothetical protein [Flavobacterium sp. WC2509]|uniref:hypothetical protein n=1 Tax=Flavobacterium sp. WC2509 TaxID=3461406 RepID=UPI004043CD27
MKKFLLLMNVCFLISQVSFAKAVHSNALSSKASHESFKFEGVTTTSFSSSNTAEITRSRVWLNLTNSGGAFKQLLLGYMAGATNGWDNLYDGVSIDSNPYVDFYSIGDGQNLTIQARGLPFLDTDEVPLGYKAKIEGEFQISIDHFDGLFVDQAVFLKDKTTGVVHNLKNGAYTFTTSIGRFNDRFVLLYVNHIPEEPIAAVPDPIDPTPIVIVPPVVEVPIVTVPEVPAPIVTEPVVEVPIVTVPEVPAPIVTEPVVQVPVVTVPEVPAPIATEPVVEEPAVAIIEGTVYEGKQKSLVVSVNNDQISINSKQGPIQTILVYSMGQIQLFERKNVNSKEFVIPNLGVARQVLIVNTQLNNGKWIASKIIL